MRAGPRPIGPRKKNAEGGGAAKEKKPTGSRASPPPHQKAPTPPFSPHPLQNGTLASVKSLVAGLNALDPLPPSVQVVVAPTALHLASVASTLRPDWGVAAQDAYDGGAGAFTGAVPAELALDAGATWTLVGHSERRALFGDADAVVTAKVTKALAVGLSVIACVGETLAQREAGDAEAVVSTQLAAIAAGVAAPADWGRLVVAYEPVWAIGTGKVATPAVAQEMHAAIRAWVASNVSADVADALRLQYGGSVSPANAADLAACPDVDGFLVGGASLKADAFGEIVKAGATA